jgi:NAD(P)-dependent dehydrogenase (short-subunit alcohol dehydrogenase family)
MADAQRSIFVTGAASGIGKATAQLFAANGWLVAAADRDAEGLRVVADACGAIAYPLDVADRDAVCAALDNFGQRTGGTLDCLFANAGIDAKGPFAAMDWARIVAVIEVNLLGAMSVIHAALPLLRRTDNALCLVTASGSAIFGVAGMAAYSASKRGLRGLVEALAIELAPTGVRVADLLPGIVDTGMLTPEAKASLPKQGKWRPITAGEVAETAWSAYHSTSLHHFVPSELAEYDRRATLEPDVVRDDWIAGKMP